jgi:membrane protein
MSALARWWPAIWRALHRTVVSATAHDCLNVAQSTAYSAIVALFPALIVAAAVIGLLPDTAPVRFQLAAFFDRVLPPGVSQLLDAAFESSPEHAHSVRALFSAGIVSFLGASSVIATLMEGLRRARELPADCWSFWARRRRAFELVPLSLVPLAVASMLVVFGHLVAGWIVPSVTPAVRASVMATIFFIRWVVSLSASVGVIALIYHLGVPDVQLRVPEEWARWPARPVRRLLRRASDVRDDVRGDVRGDVREEATASSAPRSWRAALPGAVLATAMWFLTTLVFGWYVTRFANYSEVYGSLGAGIALLFWLYIVSLSVLCGAEFNAQFGAQVHARLHGEAAEAGQAQVRMEEKPNC